MHLDVESLRTWLAVLDRGGMTRAAEHLGLSQSSVSWKIKRLEERVGKPLLIRDGHTVRPSRDGRALLDDARTIVSLHDRAVARLRTSDLAGVVRVGANEEADAERMAAVLGMFRHDHPAATIEFRRETTERLRRDVDAGEIDVAIVQVTTDDLRPSDVVLWTDRLRWLTGADTPHDRGEVPLITFGEQCFYRALSEPLLDEAGVDYSVSLSFPSSAAIRAALAAGLGVGVLGARSLGDGVVEWSRAGEFPPLPDVHQIVRTVPGERADVAEVLIGLLVTELAERHPSAA